MVLLVCFRLLVRKCLIHSHRSAAKDEYNALVLAAREAKERLTGATPLVGACVPALFSTALARIKMALIPNLTLAEVHGRDDAWTMLVLEHAR